jgi:hypothetical protein
LCTIRLSGTLADLDRLLVTARLDDLDLKLFDYRLNEETSAKLIEKLTDAEADVQAPVPQA